MTDSTRDGAVPNKPAPSFRPLIDPLHMTHRPIDRRKLVNVGHRIARQTAGGRQHMHGDIQPMEQACRRISATATLLAIALVVAVVVFNLWRGFSG